MARPDGATDLGPVAGCNSGSDVSHLPVRAKVASRPFEPILRMRHGPASAMYRSPARSKAIAAGDRNQASRAGVPSGAGSGLPPPRVFSIPSGRDLTQGAAVSAVAV